MSRKIKHLKSIKELLPPNQIENNEKEESWQETRDRMLVEQTKIKPLNRAQERFLNAIYTSVITIAYGPAGTGRSFLSCAAAIKMHYEGKIEKIILCRPQITCDEDSGYLPGDASEKIAPYLYPLTDAIQDIVGDKEYNRLLKDGKIIFATLGLLRGSSFKNSVFILDEAQNCNYKQLKMVLTRIGRNCTMIINGDFTQSDLTIRNKDDFGVIVDKVSKLHEVSIIKFTIDDVVRSGIVRELIRIL